MTVFLLLGFFFYGGFIFILVLPLMCLLYCNKPPYNNFSLWRAEIMPAFFLVLFFYPQLLPMRYKNTLVHRAGDMCGRRGRRRRRWRGRQCVHPDAAVLFEIHISSRVRSTATSLGPEAPLHPHPARLPPTLQPGVCGQHPCSRLQGIQGLCEAVWGAWILC